MNWNLIEIPAGRDGITRVKNATLLRASQLAYADNITAERLAFEKMPGASKVNTVALSGDVLGHWDWIYGNPATQELVAYVDDGASASLVTVNGSGVVATLKSGLTTGGFPWFEEGWTGSQRVLYIFNGLNTPQVYTGGGVPSTDITNPSADWAVNKPAAAGQTRTRMVAWGNSNFSHSLYLTVPGAHSNYTGGESAVERIFPGEGQKITAGKFHKERFYIGKYPLGIYYLDDSDISPANWSRYRVTNSIGTGGPGCMLDIGDDLIIFGTDGYFYALSQIRTQGQVSIPPFLAQETSEFIKEKVNLAYLHKVRSIWFGHKRQAWFAVPSTNSTECDAIIIFDLMEPENPKLLYSTRDVCTSLTLRRASVTAVQKPSFGDTDGFIWQGDQSARNKGGAAYTAQYETVPVPLMPGALTRGNLEQLHVVMQPQGNWDLTLEVLRDGVSSQTVAYSMQTPGAAAGTISLDSDVLAGQTIANVRHRIYGDCRYVKLIGQNDNADENFAVMSHIVEFSKGNDR